MKTMLAWAAVRLSAILACVGLLVQPVLAQVRESPNLPKIDALSGVEMFPILVPRPDLSPSAYDLKSVTIAKLLVSSSRRAVLQRLVDRSDAASAGNPIDQPVYSDDTATVTEASGGGTLTGRIYTYAANPTAFDVSGGTPLLGTYTDGTTQFARFGSSMSLIADNVASEPTAPFTTTPYYRSNGWRVRFWTDAPTLELRTVGSAKSAYRIIANGKYLSKTPTAMGGNAYRAIKVAFTDGSAAPVRKSRLIEFEFSGPVGFYGVNVDALSSVYPPSTLERIDAAMIGDSYTAGTGATNPTQSYSVVSYAPVLSRLLGWSAPQLEALGGTGYTVVNSSGKFIDRIADMNQRPFDVVTIAGGYNDAVASVAPSDIATAALAEWQAVRARQPSALIVVTGVWSPPANGATQRAQQAAAEDAIAAMFAAWSDPFSLYVPIVRAQTAWITGTGYSGATVGDGNGDIYINADKTHPNDAGHEWIARRFASSVRAGIQALYKTTIGPISLNTIPAANDHAAERAAA